MFAQERQTDLRLADEPPRYDERGVRHIPPRNRERNVSDILSLHQDLERHRTLQGEVAPYRPKFLLDDGAALECGAHHHLHVSTGPQGNRHRITAEEEPPPFHDIRAVKLSNDVERRKQRTVVTGQRFVRMPLLVFFVGDIDMRRERTVRNKIRRRGRGRLYLHPLGDRRRLAV